ncbi:MAG: anti-sigma factor antagonist [Archangiaceae bacterium]|nr:anti-sigma factor antagonist [Archangiaceae bacterium]
MIHAGQLLDPTGGASLKAALEPRPSGLLVDFSRIDRVPTEAVEHLADALTVASLRAVPVVFVAVDQRVDRLFSAVGAFDRVHRAETVEQGQETLLAPR